MTIGTTLSIVFLLIANVFLSLAYINMGRTIDDLLEILTKQHGINEVTYQTSQVLKDRIDAVALLAEDAVKKHDATAQQIANLNNKTALINSDLRRIKSSCIEVK